MAIRKPPVPAARSSVDDFINAAPDAAAAPARREPRYVRKGRKLQITLTIEQALLEQVDKQASELGLSRAAVINLSIRQGINRGITLTPVSAPPEN
jgi:hypothetical protein